MIIFAQSFSLGDAGDGPRILRSVFDQPLTEVLSICTGFRHSLPDWPGPELLIPMRPPLGRLDRTRFHWLGGYVEQAFKSRFQRRIRAEFLRLRPLAVHLVPHSWGDFAVIAEVCREMSIPIHISIHDDFLYTAADHPFRQSLLRKLGRVWREATTCFVISEEMGLEYCRRYGQRPFVIHTDGVRPRPPFAYQPPRDELKIYFMGMYHNAYAPNIEALLQALAQLKAERHGALDARLIMRTAGYRPSPDLPGIECLQLLPFASQGVVEEEMRQNHLLYLPLPFGEEWSHLWRFSLSTKMITYLASGVPVLYQGPAESAACHYLSRNQAAVNLHTNDVAALIQQLSALISDAPALQTVAANGPVAAARDFDVTVLRKRFWDGLLSTATQWTLS